MSQTNKEEIKEKMFDKYNEFIEFGDNELEERLFRLPALVGYYQNVFYTMQKKHTKYTYELDIIWQERYLYYKNDFNFALTNTEIKSFIGKDLEYLHKKLKLQEVTDVLNQVEIVLKGLDQMRWSIKSLIDWKKFQMGVYT